MLPSFLSKTIRFKSIKLVQTSICQITRMASGDGGAKMNDAVLSHATRDVMSPEFRAIFSDELKQLEKIFQKHNHEIRIAGGAVRDFLMGNKPSDLDFATTATPDQMIDMFTVEEIRMLNTKGEKHGYIFDYSFIQQGGAGTITCRLNDKENFEVTTLRIDKSCDGRFAEVQFTDDWKLDAERRDLTINSLFLDFNGTVHDYFGGITDLENRRVIFVGNAEKRIQEDYLRILRYFRFYGRIADADNLHESETIEAIKMNVNGLSQISGERIWSELKKIVVGRFAPSSVRVMIESGLAPYLGLPNQSNIDNLERIYDRCRHLDPQPMTVVSALLESVDEVYQLEKRLKFSTTDRLLGAFICTYRHSDIPPLKTDFESDVDDITKFYQDLVLDQPRDMQQGQGRSRVIELAKYRGDHDVIDHLNEWIPPKCPVDGLMVANAGVKKGPNMKKVLDILFGHWKDSNYKLLADQLIKMIPDQYLTQNK